MEQRELLRAQERRITRQARKRKPPRDAATNTEFDAAIQVICDSDSTTFCKARDCTCLLFMYLFGLRINNLLLLTATHLQSTT